MKTIIQISLALFATLASFSGNAQWSPLTTGATTGYIMDLIRHDNEIYACGSITQIGGVAVNSVAKYDDTAWQPIGITSEWVHKLQSYNGNLYAMPYSTTTDSNYIWQWSGAQWGTLYHGFYLTTTNAGQYHFCSLYDMAMYNNSPVVAGEFDVAGGVDANGIAQWDGSNWNALGDGLTEPMTGLNIYPHKMLVHNNNLYVVGNFKKAGGTTVNGIARWDGSQWQAVGDGFNGVVYGLEVYNGDMYACGEFTQSGSNALGCVAKWDGAEWVNPGVTLGTNIPGYKAFGHTLKVLQGKLFVAGGFNMAEDANGNTLNIKNVTAYDGTTWLDMDGGTNGDAEGLIDYNTQVLVGGGFTSAGGVTVNSVGLWNPTTSMQSISSAKASIYPNPAANSIYINLAQAQPTTIAIYNMLGVKVLQTTATRQEIRLDISGLPVGNYLMSLIQQGEAISVCGFSKM